jgi:hypothetical protein
MALQTVLSGVMSQSTRSDLGKLMLLLPPCGPKDSGASPHLLGLGSGMSHGRRIPNLMLGRGGNSSAFSRLGDQHDCQDAFGFHANVLKPLRLCCRAVLESVDYWTMSKPISRHLGVSLISIAALSVIESSHPPPEGTISHLIAANSPTSCGMDMSLGELSGENWTVRGALLSLAPARHKPELVQPTRPACTLPAL